MWENLDAKNANLESAFEPLLYRADDFSRVWSIGELSLSASDVQWLHTWFVHAKAQDAQSWLQPGFFANLQGSYVSYPHMLGGLLIAMSAEVCREHSREDSVWPAIRSILPLSHPLHNDLFLANGQPSALAREMIGGAAHFLNLRNAIDIEGTQQWFVTIKLQFGFTLHGAKSRLAEWLVGLGPPQAVQYLNGDSGYPELASDSFQSLWLTLKQFRRGWIEEEDARAVMASNPWVKPQWINDLLIEAKARIDALGTGEWPGTETPVHPQLSTADEFCPVADISLEWPPGGTPSLKFILDTEAIEDEIGETSATEIDFLVDGTRVGLWRRQPDRSWAGQKPLPAEPPKSRNKPNLSPAILTAFSRSGQVFFEWDLADSGLPEEVVVFDLDNSHMVRAGSERLHSSGNYAIVCDRTCTIQGCRPVETFEADGIARKVLRLPTPVEETFSIAYGDFMLWQPILPQSDSGTPFGVTVTASGQEVLSFDDRTHLVLHALPEDAKDVRLLIHRTTYVVEHDGRNWHTVKAVALTPELAAGRRRMRVRFEQDSQTYSVRPRISLPLLAAAMVRHNADIKCSTLSLEALREGSVVNRSEGTSYLRVWAPDQDKDAVLFEGESAVARLRRSKVKLQDIPGHGGELLVVAKAERMSLSLRCRDRGCIRTFLPSMLGSPAQLFLLRDKAPEEAGDDGYIVYEWTPDSRHRAKLQRVAVLPGSNHRVWQIRPSENMLALALTWKGVWRGAWCSLERIREYISNRKCLPQHDFAVLKWLRVPILDPALEPTIHKAILDSPTQFVRSWKSDDGLPSELHPHDHIPHQDSIIRHFIWDKSIGVSWKDVATVVGSCDYRFDGNRCCQHLENLLDVSFRLFWRWLIECQKKCPMHSCSLCRLFLHSRVGLPENTRGPAFSNRIHVLRERVLSVTGLSPERLEEIILKGCPTADNPGLILTAEDSSDLLMLSGINSGRKYLGARIVQHWMDQQEH